MTLCRFTVVRLEDISELLFATDGGMGLWFERLSNMRVPLGECHKDNLSEGLHPRIVRRRSKAERTPRTVSSTAVPARDSIPAAITRSPLAPGHANASARVSAYGFACTPALFLPPSMISTLSVCVKTRSTTRFPVCPCGSPLRRTTTPYVQQAVICSRNVMCCIAVYCRMIDALQKPT